MKDIQLYKKFRRNGMYFEQTQLAILIVIGAARAIYRYLKKKKTKSSNKKKNQLKEIVVEATGSTQGMVLKPFKQTMPMKHRIQTATMSPH